MRQAKANLKRCPGARHASLRSAANPLYSSLRSSPARSLQVFYAWCLNKFTYRDVILTDKEIESFTEGYRTAFLHENKDPEDRINFNESLPKGVTYLPTVKYIKAKKVRRCEERRTAAAKRRAQAASVLSFLVLFYTIR